MCIRDSNDTGHSARRLRRNKIIPGVVYGRKLGSLLFEIGQMELTRDLREIGEHGVVNFNLDGYSGMAVIKEVQKDVVTHDVIHLDLEEVDQNSEIEAEVPVVFNGKDFLNEKGVVLQTQKDKIKVSCKPEDLPKSIEFNIKNARIGSVFKLGDVEVGSEISIVDDLESVLASVCRKQFIFEPEEEIEKIQGRRKNKLK
eukprot:TRINITY_DN2696_c0_g1_i2.p3 TRINITY_DN2696_c0_g1~~TRINITY_DN2696_c0_g1_i2.p3  ORF type:complete len:199 (-),score=38.15 TRINITY_DN2696_c0_g1_i2:1078-1674(-)